MRMKKSLQKNKGVYPAPFKKGAGFSLLETLVYIAILSIMIVAIISFVLWSIHSNAKTKVIRETLDNAERIMRIMTQEIREAKSIYTPTTTSGQLALQTTKYLSQGEEDSYIDFYLCDSRLCFKKESQDAIVLTSDNVEMTNLVFTQILSGEAPSVQISLTIDYKNPANRSEYQFSVNLTSTASLRPY